MTIQEIKQELREIRKEMKAKGIRRISCFNAGLSGEVYSLNARIFWLNTRLEQAQRNLGSSPKPSHHATVLP